EDEGEQDDRRDDVALRAQLRHDLALRDDARRLPERGASAVVVDARAAGGCGEGAHRTTSWKISVSGRMAGEKLRTEPRSMASRSTRSASASLGAVKRTWPPSNSSTSMPRMPRTKPASSVSRIHSG